MDLIRRLISLQWEGVGVQNWALGFVQTNQMGGHRLVLGRVGDRRLGWAGIGGDALRHSRPTNHRLWDTAGSGGGGAAGK